MKSTYSHSEPSISRMDPHVKFDSDDISYQYISLQNKTPKERIQKSDQELEFTERVSESKESFSRIDRHIYYHTYDSNSNLSCLPSFHQTSMKNDLSFLKIATINVQSKINRENMKLISRYLIKTKPDIIALQQCSFVHGKSSGSNILKNLAQKMKYYFVFGDSTATTFGNAILSRFKFVDAYNTQVMGNQIYSLLKARIRIPVSIILEEQVKRKKDAQRQREEIGQVNHGTKLQKYQSSVSQPQENVSQESLHAVGRMYKKHTIEIFPNDTSKEDENQPNLEVHLSRNQLKEIPSTPDDVKAMSTRYHNHGKDHSSKISCLDPLVTQDETNTATTPSKESSIPPIHSVSGNTVIPTDTMNTFDALRRKQLSKLMTSFNISEDPITPITPITPQFTPITPNTPITPSTPILPSCPPITNISQLKQSHVEESMFPASSLSFFQGNSPRLRPSHHSYWDRPDMYHDIDVYTTDLTGLQSQPWSVMKEIINQMAIQSQGTPHLVCGNFKTTPHCSHSETKSMRIRRWNKKDISPNFDIYRIMELFGYVNSYTLHQNNSASQESKASKRAAPPCQELIWQDSKSIEMTVPLQFYSCIHEQIEGVDQVSVLTTFKVCK